MPAVDWIVANNGCDHDEVYDITAQVKNNGFAAWWPGGHNNQGAGYCLSTRGACHMAGMLWGANGGVSMIRDAGVFCQFGSQGGVSAYGYYDFLNACLGRNLTKEQWDAHGERAVMLEICFNINEGFRARDNYPPARLHAVNPDKYDDGTPTVHPGISCTREFVEQKIAEYCEAAAVDPETFCPTRGKLQEMNLDDVIPYMEKALATTGESMK